MCYLLKADREIIFFFTMRYNLSDELTFVGYCPATNLMHHPCTVLLECTRGSFLIILPFFTWLAMATLACPRTSNVTSQ